MSPWEPGPRLLGNLYIIILGTLTTFTWKTWEPCREPWRNLEGTFWEPFGHLEGTLRNLGNLEGTLGTFTWEPGNLYLGTCTFTWEPVLGTCTWNLGTLGESVLELLRSAPKPLLRLKTPKHSAVGEKNFGGVNPCVRPRLLMAGEMMSCHFPLLRTWSPQLVRIVRGGVMGCDQSPMCTLCTPNLLLARLLRANVLSTRLVVWSTAVLVPSGAQWYPWWIMVGCTGCTGCTISGAL